MSRILYWLIAILLAGSLVLTYISWLKICTEQCAEGSLYRIWGFPFETWGFAFFGVALFCHLMTPRFPILGWPVVWLLSGALGAESWFIYLQKYVIGHWCPICLSIASVIAVSLFLSIWLRRVEAHHPSHPISEELNMRSSTTALLSAATAIFGFLFAFLGIAKIDPIEAAEDSFQQRISFGRSSSPIEVYVFSDWFCPLCRKLEPVIANSAPLIMEKGKLFFLDMPVHEATTNFTPYNFSFMIYNKEKYLALRGVLEHLAQKTKDPTEEQVAEAARSIGATFKPLSFAEIALGLKYSKAQADRWKLTGTPTVVLVNTLTKRGQKLVGSQISRENIDKAIDRLMTAN